MDIYLLRHGKSEENEKNTYYGAIDCSLSYEGINQGNRVKEKLRGIDFQCAYVSPTKRTLETLNLVKSSKDLVVNLEERLIEINFGDFEGKNYDELLRLYPSECEQWKDNWKDFTPPGGESYVQLYKRVESFMKELINKDYEKVLLVTHSGVIRTIYTYVLGGNLDLFWGFGCKNCDLAIIKYEYGNLYIDSITHC